MNETAVALLVLVVAVPLLWGLMWLGWRARGRRQERLPPPPAAPDQVGPELLAGVEAVYVSSTPEGLPLDRVVVHGLGVRSNAVVRVGGSGVLVERQGAPDLWLPAESVRGVRLERGMVGKFVEKEGLVVLTWQLGDVRLDTGLRVRHDADRDRLVRAVSSLVEVTR